MFKNVDEIKEFIMWAKSQGVQSAVVGEVRFELGASATYNSEDFSKTEEKNTSVTMVDTDTMTKEEQEELEFWSAN